MATITITLDTAETRLAVSGSLTEFPDAVTTARALLPALRLAGFVCLHGKPSRSGAGRSDQALTQKTAAAPSVSPGAPQDRKGNGHAENTKHPPTS
jgi:hypothetical protein